MRTILSQWIEFRKSNVWHDLVEELNAWLNDGHVALENPETTREEDLVSKGRIVAIRDVRNMIDTIIEDLERPAEEPEEEINL